MSKMILFIPGFPYSTFEQKALKVDFSKKVKHEKTQAFQLLFNST